MSNNNTGGNTKQKIYELLKDVDDEKKLRIIYCVLLSYIDKTKK